uniref:Uncharacterized protein n=1 Tax=Podoviridae sp. ctKmJ5 TaxID=2827732 RepID=A0A8S5SYC7_9CAUD|nr:MAG TPA: protein of unknown function (DUF4183) [Podoviridae sp. ctKmJ5]
MHRHVVNLYIKGVLSQAPLFILYKNIMNAYLNIVTY